MLDYVAAVETALRQQTLDRLWFAKATAILDGGTEAYINKAHDLEERRSKGIFFTPERTASALLDLFSFGRSKICKVFDPTCGAGNLLIAVARRLPLGNTLSQTLCQWGEALAGCDIVPGFVDVAKYRLALLAKLRHRDSSPWIDGQQDLFPLIVVGDGLNETQNYANADLVVLNPPYNRAYCPKSVRWTSGKVNVAALFICHALLNMREHARVAAVLPDVLRSGSRYAKWRSTVSDLAEQEKIHICGQFDRNVDVDVFLISMLKNAGHAGRRIFATTIRSASHEGMVADKFDVSVGPVVPFRDKASKPRRPYVSSRGLPSWKVFRPKMQVRTDGKGVMPPFVVVRRTSRPGAVRRAIATIVVGDSEIAIENHLLVLVPKDRKLATCSNLLKRLDSQNTDKWLNRRMRCRHLTVESLRELPWWTP